LSLPASIAETPREDFDWPVHAYHRANQLWPAGRASSPSTDMVSDSLCLCMEAFPEETGTILSRLPTPIAVCFHCMFSYCQDICKSAIVSSSAVLENVT
jgi:hypothetical protein